MLSLWGLELLEAIRRIRGRGLVGGSASLGVEPQSPCQAQVLLCLLGQDVSLSYGSSTTCAAMLLP